jgi:hypothetical protein
MIGIHWILSPNVTECVERLARVCDRGRLFNPRMLQCGRHEPTLMPGVESADRCPKHGVRARMDGVCRQEVRRLPCAGPAVSLAT